MSETSCNDRADESSNFEEEQLMDSKFRGQYEQF